MATCTIHFTCCRSICCGCIGCSVCCDGSAIRSGRRGASLNDPVFRHHISVILLLHVKVVTRGSWFVGGRPLMPLLLLLLLLKQLLSMYSPISLVL